MKKVLSLVLVLAMVLVCVSAYAGVSPQAGAVIFRSYDDHGGGADGDYNGNNGDGYHTETKTYYGGSNTYDSNHNNLTLTLDVGGVNINSNNPSTTTTFGGSNTYGSYNTNYGGSNTYFGGSNTYGSYNTEFGGSNTYGSYNTEFGGSNTYGSYNRYSTVTISGSGNTDSSNHSTNFFYFGSFNDNSDYSTNDSYNQKTTTKDSGNSSSSSSSSAAAGGTSGKSGSGSGSSSGSGKSSGSSSGSSKGASSSASSKAVVVTSGNGGGSSSGSSTVAPSIQLVQVADTAETTALKNAFAEAIKAGDPKTALPENIASKLSADLKTINEFVTAKLVGDISGLASATVNVAFPTKYAAGDKVVVLFGIPNGASTQWINVNGIIESDGSISMILTSTVLEALAGKTFALAVLSK